MGYVAMAASCSAKHIGTRCIPAFTAVEDAGRAQDKAGHRQWETRQEAGDRASEAELAAKHKAQRKGGCSIM